MSAATAVMGQGVAAWAMAMSDGKGISARVGFLDLPRASHNDEGLLRYDGLNGLSPVLFTRECAEARAFDGAGWVAVVHSDGVSRIPLLEEKLTHSVIGAFFEVYNTLGYGFLEHIYVLALERELLARGHRVQRELLILVRYKGEELARQRMDMIVDDKLIVETKSTHELHKSAPRQTYNYLKATSLEVALLLHFGPEPRFYRLICRATEKYPVKSVQSVASAPTLRPCG